MLLHSLAPHLLLQRTLRFDRVVLAIAVLFVGILLLIPQQFRASAGFTLASLVSIAPYLAISVGIAAYLKAAGADHLIARVFSGHPVLMIVSASLFGALSPFCSCGVIPIIAALLAMGVPLPPIMAFWVSSPLMAPDMFVLTAGELGLGFAVAKTISAVGIGLVAGFGTQAIQNAGFFSSPLREGIAGGCCAAAPVRNAKEVVWRFWDDPERRKQFGRGAVETGWFLLRWLTLAFALESLMVAYLPTATVAAWVGGESLWAIPLSVIIGVPAYLNGYAAIPVVGGLMASGMAPGAAMAFMSPPRAPRMGRELA
jgi:uncharacterized membrane protein YraQ (UPF0718 family)